MKWLIGIDGGSTKTQAVLCDETGYVHNKTLTEGCSLTNVSKDEVTRRLTGVLDKLFKNTCERKTAEGSCFGGFSGGDTGWKPAFLHENLKILLPSMVTRNGHDSVIALTNGIGKKDGIVVIAGTGSGAFARTGDTVHRVGGWGYKLSDEGSGYDLGRRALMAVLHAHDGLGEATILTALCEEKLGESIINAIARINNEEPSFIASFAPLLLEARDKGDPVACMHAEEAAKALSKIIFTAGKYISSPNKQVVLSGSVWKSIFMEKRVSELLGEDFHFIHPELPPVFGAAIEAAALQGITADLTFKNKFQNSF